jgi:hypothetical protein
LTGNESRKNFMPISLLNLQKFSLSGLIRGILKPQPNGEKMEAREGDREDDNDTLLTFHGVACSE